MGELEQTESLKILIRNETQKLTANFLNTCGTTMVAIGVLTPTINAILTDPGTLSPLAILGFFSFGIILHLWGRAFLADMEEAP
ncbi:hypothetical protein FE840_010105 [Peteryoungia desertarenae]|uniref:Uncharacterized protein n=1 Tax=Peteryoungia desertarenae TaxID=1813451 RepID=A0ABX6QNL1_9HYPH|nr:hypothetical protein [Peteryoungia desertarenae]QLF69862.1 hypothetical protein FE840_010105 [Peteryoungia desertarenae]